MTTPCRGCGHQKAAHAHYLPGFSHRALTELAYTWCSLCPEGGCPRYRRTWPWRLKP
jgi:hypothetical protein